MRHHIVTLILAFTAFTAQAQTLKGHIYGNDTKEPLPGVTISFPTGKTIGVTDAGGAYEIKLAKGSNSLLFSYIGYENGELTVIFKDHETISRDIYLKPETSLMNEVVVTAGKFAQKMSDVTVTMDLLKANDISRQQPVDLSYALRTIPGVDIVDRQPSIRGGGGWTYGVGSRSLVLLDGFSVLEPQTGNMNWNQVPLQNIEQVEIIKGASSVLYGSSALNGIINVRTARPDIEPKTHISTYVGIYNNYKNDGYDYGNNKFWKRDGFAVKPLLRSSLYNGINSPIYEGWDITHSRRIGNFDLVAGMNIFSDEGYREQNFNQRINVSGRLTYHQPMKDYNYLNYGTGLDYNYNKYGDFIIWRSATEPLKPSPYTNMGRKGGTFRVSPFLNYNNTETGISHRLRTYYYYADAQIFEASEQKNISDILNNMGTDENGLQNVLNGDYNDALLPLIQPAMQGGLNAILQGDFTNPNVGDLYTAVQTALKTIFPKSTMADYNDLISWISQHDTSTDIMSSIQNGTLKDDLTTWFQNAKTKGNTSINVPNDHINNWYVDYQFGKQWNGGAHITSGLTYDHQRFNSGYMKMLHSTDASVDYTHDSDNISLYMQYDQKFFDRLSVSGGVRCEYYRVDDHYREAKTQVLGTQIPFKPVFRAGINYELAPYSFLRASFGQGYRYPSITEKFLVRNIGGGSLYPNPNLSAEHGFNAEIGLKQGYKIGKLMGYADVAAFYTQYRDMIEFGIGLFNNSTFKMINSTADMISLLLNGQSLGVGSNFHNVDKAQIYGVEITMTGMYDFSRDVKLIFNTGYTFSNPIDADYKNINEREDAYTDPLEMKSKSNRSKYLKYRPKHTFKFSGDIQWKRYSVGANVSWRSKILAVDYLMVDERTQDPTKFNPMAAIRHIVFGDEGSNTLANYWHANNTDKATLDLRMGVNFTKCVGLQMQLNNVTNNEISNRPMSLEAPRTFVAKVNIDF
jgi:outer membrane receptor protein involved in Fe transport